jgi:hypothetical protein
MVVAFVNIRDGTVATLPTGWTQLGTSANADSNAYVYARKLDGSEDYTDTFTTTSAGAFKVSAQWVYVQNYAGVVADVDFAGSTASTTNPPAVTASVPGDHWVFTAILGNKGLPVGGTETAPDNVPSGYTFQCYNGFTASASGNPRVYSARRLVTIATTEDPGAFNYDDGGAGGRFFWLVTLAVPAGAFDPEVAKFDHDHDHGGLSGLADDDHTQYTLVDGSRAFTGTVSGVTPTIDAHLATKGYADSVGGAGGTPDYAYDDTDNADATDIRWTGSVSAGMTTVTVTGSQTLTEKTGVLSVLFSGQSTQDYNCLLTAHTFSVGDSFAVPIRYAGNAGIGAAGVIFTDGTTSAANAVAAHMQQHSNEGHTRVYTRHGTLTAMGSVSTVHNHRSALVPWLWLRLTYQASNTFRKELSPDGISWHTTADESKTMTPTHVGVCWSTDNNSGDGIATFGPIVKLA